MTATTTQEHKMDRFGLPKSFRDFLAVAVKADAIDAAEAFCEGAAFAMTVKNNGRNVAIQDTINSVLDAAFASRHHNGEGHRACVKAAEAVWKEVCGNLN